MEGEQATDATPKRAKTDGTGERDELEDGGDAMMVDGDEGLKREPDLRERVAAYLRDPATALKPDPPDVPSFMESPFRYNPKAKILNPEETQGKVDADGNTALIMAIKAGSEKAFFLLLDGKDQAYINRQNSKGATALNVAAHRGYVAPVRELLDTAHADVNIPNSSGSTSLIQASHFGHTAVVRLLLQHGAAVDLPNHKGTTALMRAAQEGHVAVVAALLRTGGDVNRRNHERMNALMLASQRGHDGIVHMLIKHGADIDCQTVQGSTALMLACKRQHEAVVRVLLTAGAEMFVRDSRGRTARDTAVKRNHKPIIAMLQASRQVRLMQQEARIVRSRVLVHMYELIGRKRAVPIPEVAAGLAARENRRRSREEARRAQTQHQEWGQRAYGQKGGGEGPMAEVLCRAMELPFPLFRHIERFIPWPRLWGPLLPILHKRCHVDANEALRGALGIMDEVLTDLNVSTDAVQEMHLVRAAAYPAMRACLCAKRGMPSDLAATITGRSRMQPGSTTGCALGGGDPDSDGPGGAMREDEGTGVEMGQDEEEEEEEEEQQLLLLQHQQQGQVLAVQGGAGMAAHPTQIVTSQHVHQHQQQHVAAPMAMGAGGTGGNGGVAVSFMQVGVGGGNMQEETGSDSEG
ncbi:hypothetical protein NSK_006529 [Nannochloropsis salina CCMP1776]|uniref:Uncharacterized protein n=1 Tax=Nannochloropsis salina CCMP1776 TaxID=1027361 RepID=A0A4D9CSP7_9STRA|nr:hypothetical protein NSK_006529 [Nannochloropsis salina CCMP1776]|eukprot:TFJ82200.1 hypothetical protein NSK_006529 [Nannochloropsis salina CCMP1776]